MVEQVGVGAVFLVEGIGEGKEFVVGFDDGFFHALETHLAVAEVFLYPERDKRGVEHLLIETIVAQGIDELDEMGDLARVDDAEAVDIPAHGVGGLIDPPIMVVAETNVTPAESRSCFGHERENFSQRASGVSKNKHKTGSKLQECGRDFFARRNRGGGGGDGSGSCVFMSGFQGQTPWA